ncbi:elongation factor Ts [Vibrio breoganii]
MGTKPKQKQIQAALNALGWSHSDFADVLYEELNENSDFRETDKSEIRKLAQNLKKQLQRPSTSDAMLDKYLRILSEHPDYVALNLGTIMPQFVEHACLDEQLKNQLSALSIALDSKRPE